MSRIRVLVVEDSTTVRKRIVEVLSSRRQFEVVGEAEDGKRGIELCMLLHPDVVTLDMVMPVMSGLAATEYIMAYCPTPILIVSSSTNRGELFKTYDALAAGALDVLEKPLSTETDQVWEERLVSTLQIIARIKVITHPRAKLSRTSSSRQAESLPEKARSNNIRLVAMGGSTGAPGAVLQILKGLPSSFPVPILLVLHLNKNFGSAFAEWLNGESPLPVAYAVNAEPLPSTGKGRVVLAPPDKHLIIKESRLNLTEDPERHSCRPSVDILFESVAREVGPGSVACLLTGMGKDGAEGLMAIRNAGGMTVAQDEESSIVFGMPKEAILLGAAEKVLPLETIATELLSLAGNQKK